MFISTTLTDKRIADLLHGHQGGMSPWLHSLTGNLIQDGRIGVHFDKEDDEEGDGKGKLVITREEVQKGLTLMAQNSPNQWAQFMTENDDDITFDTAIQYIIFGKLVYA